LPDAAPPGSEFARPRRSRQALRRHSRQRDRGPRAGPGPAGPDVPRTGRADHHRGALGEPGAGPLGALEPVSDELCQAAQARILRLLVERIDVAPHGISVTLHAAGTRSLIAELANETAAEGAMLEAAGCHAGGRRVITERGFKVDPSDHPHPPTAAASAKLIMRRGGHHPASQCGTRPYRGPGPRTRLGPADRERSGPLAHRSG
jgi:hypothetical protein